MIPRLARPAATRLVALLLFGIAVLQTSSHAMPGRARASAPARERAMALLTAGPLSFEANRGQMDPAVRFAARGDGYTLFLTGTDAVLSLRKSGSAAPAPL